MDAAVMIRRVGFRKWYERELRQSHMYLVLLILSAIGLIASLEAYAMRTTGSAAIAVLLCAAASASIGLWALRRYLYLLLHAEFVADQAVCRGCEAYAQWDVQARSDGGSQRLYVCCRKCQHQWFVEL